LWEKTIAFIAELNEARIATGSTAEILKKIFFPFKETTVFDLECFLAFISGSTALKTIEAVSLLGKESESPKLKENCSCTISPLPFLLPVNGVLLAHGKRNSDTSQAL